MARYEFGASLFPSDSMSIMPNDTPSLQNDASWNPDAESLVVKGNNLDFIRTLPTGSFRLIYIDPPFNTGKVQTRQTMKTVRSMTGTRVGFKGQTYDTIKGVAFGYNDLFEDYWEFLEPRLEEAWRLLSEDGTLYLHLDYREVHYAKVLLDALFGRESFLNEIIWAYDYGARSKNKWPAKHDNILVYVKNPSKYYFNSAEVDREPYMAPGLVTPEKVALGKLPTDTWWHTIVSPNGREKTGYPTQKPLGILRRVIQASSEPGDWVLDFFAGSGTTGAAALELDRKFILVDQNPEAIDVMRARLGAGTLGGEVTFVEFHSLAGEAILESAVNE
jgi:site-specific DNA-methyltransferase (adenine-specific)